MLNSKRRGVYYTSAALLSDAKAELALKTKFIRRLSRKSNSDIASFISKRRVLEIDEAEIKLANKNLIYVIESGGRSNPSDIARLLAIQSARSGRKVILCDTTGKSDKAIEDNLVADTSTFPIVDIGYNLNLMAEAKDASFFTSINFGKTIKKLTDDFDQIFLCASNLNANLGLMALENFDTSFVLISGLRSTRNWT